MYTNQKFSGHWWIISVFLWAHIQLPLRDIHVLTDSGRDHAGDWCVEKALLRGGATFGCGQGRLKTKSSGNKFSVWSLYKLYLNNVIAQLLHYYHTTLDGACGAQCVCAWLYCAHLLQADEGEWWDGEHGDHTVCLQRCVSMCVCAGYRTWLLGCRCRVCGAVCVVNQSKVLQGEIEDRGVWADPVGGAMTRQRWWSELLWRRSYRTCKSQQK